MFNNEKKNSLIIVCDEKRMEFADLLVALISQNDDEDGKIVGTKDNSVAAAIWTPKQYQDSRTEISSDTHVLFIGSFDEAKKHGKNIQFRFNKYGMHYGWLGKRAVIYVDNKDLKIEEYNEFIDFSKTCNLEFEKVAMKKVDSKSKKAKIIGGFVMAATAVALPVVGVGAASAAVMATNVKDKKKVREQQYRCLVMSLYLNGLQEFLEG